jgi:hypothetical protein
MAIFTAWGKHGSAYVCAPGEQLPRFVDGTAVDEGLEPIWRIEAAGWNEAMARYHELQGWEPYQPMSDND